VKKMEWRDRPGRAVECETRGPVPEPLQGGKLEFVFENLERRNIDRLELELELSMNLHPVHVKAVWARGGDLHEGEEAWLPAAPIEVEIGELPPEVQPLKER